MSKSKVPIGMQRYMVSGVITISVHTEVVAASPNAARDIAINDRPLMSLCHQCASGNPDLEWVTSGELDCDAPSPSQDKTELDVEVI